MSARSLQFAVCTHVAAVLGYWYGEPITSARIAASINAEPSFVRRAVTKLARAGLVTTTRGKTGACALARPPETITLLDIYRAAEAPPAAIPHDYPLQPACPVSTAIRPAMTGMLDRAQLTFETALGQQTLAGLLAEIRAAERMPSSA